jgi:hypothetical protein
VRGLERRGKAPGYTGAPQIHFELSERLVEAGGVEPPSEKRYDTKTTCLAHFSFFRPPRSEGARNAAS